MARPPPLPRPLKQTVWFVCLWAAGVASVALVAGVLRLVMHAAGG